MPIIKHAKFSEIFQTKTFGADMDQKFTTLTSPFSYCWLTSSSLSCSGSTLFWHIHLIGEMRHKHYAPSLIAQTVSMHG